MPSRSYELYELWSLALTGTNRSRHGYMAAMIAASDAVTIFASAAIADR
jgi:hypothetical protein